MLPNWLLGKSKSKLQEILGGGGGGGGTTYTAGDGIDITSNTISFDGSTAPYDNTNSGLKADTVQDALDELADAASYSAGTGIHVTNNVISIADPLTATLTAGSTSVTISNSAITANSFLLPVTSVWGLAPSTVTPAAGSVTMTFAAQASDITVGVMILS